MASTPKEEDSPTRPPMPKRSSNSSSHSSPMRHHRRTISSNAPVKETRNAHSEYQSSQSDGTSQLRINQYLIQREIGRGSFGAVHLATDQYGKEYAVKEFSKTRLRRRVKSNMLRQARQQNARQGIGPSTGASPFDRFPRHRRAVGDEDNSFDLIREEIAIMKKLNHVNLVSLIEVLDDPEEDSLYMVLEMCKRGVIMRIEVDECVQPYDERSCRCWFRDLILAIEYLHAQGIVHRDIKPDNCLLTEDDTLKVVDFGVSEMFEKQSEMRITKSTGSPAFMAPELCVIKHGDVSGVSTDIWSMGVTLYCLYFGRVPFQKGAVLDLWSAIVNDPVSLDPDPGPQFTDLIMRLLEKDPERRITMAKLREHPWVTLNGSDPLLPADENCSNIIPPPTEEEKNAAITSNMSRLVIVMRAVNRFKSLLERRRPDLFDGGILGQASRVVQSPTILAKANRDLPQHLSNVAGMDRNDTFTSETTSKDDVTGDAAAADNVHRVGSSSSGSVHGKPAPMDDWAGKGSSLEQSSESNQLDLDKSCANDAHGDDHLFLDIGSGPSPDESLPEFAVSESPPPVDYNVYATAYEDEVERIRKEQGRNATVYLTRRVEEPSSSAGSIQHLASAVHSRAYNQSLRGLASGGAPSRFGDLVGRAARAGFSSHSAARRSS